MAGADQPGTGGIAHFCGLRLRNLARGAATGGPLKPDSLRQISLQYMPRQIPYLTNIVHVIFERSSDCAGSCCLSDRQRNGCGRHLLAQFGPIDQA